MALQINGTTVVNNSRALQNIASVDSTTAASITSAGVGGGWSQQSTGTLSGTTPQITIPNADFVRIYLFDWRHSGGTTGSYVRFQKVGSSSVDTGFNYGENYIEYFQSGNTTGSGTGGVGKTNTTALTLMDTTNNINTHGFIEFHFPRSTSQNSFGNFRMITTNNNAYGWNTQFVHRNTTGIDKLQIFNFSSLSYAGNYEVWTA